MAASQSGLFSHLEFREGAVQDDEPTVVYVPNRTGVGPATYRLGQRFPVGLLLKCMGRPKQGGIFESLP